MDYLINEGYPDAAKRFAIEANIQEVPGDDEFIQERVDIRNALLIGDAATAIEKINEAEPELLDRNPALHFAILRLQLIELIRGYGSHSTNDIIPALTFASDFLAPLAPAHPNFLADLEQTMALLIFPPDSRTPELTMLLDPQLRQDTATAVNEALLESFGHGPKPKLKLLVKLRAWAERRAREQKVALPKTMDLWARETETGNEDSIMGGNGEAEVEPEAMER
ncbi:MAG: hypothetical protein M1828_001535 [Chrysothrix sp. TS-e1954]|nr:MAG: hypothetical protein M1828_001535 [Chrysothrix sp. TS-e1954]